MKNVFKFVTCCVAVVVFLATNSLSAQDKRASQLFANGKAQLTQGNFKKALEFYTDATRLAPNNEEYGNECTMLRRVIKIRSILEKEEDLKKWVPMALSLRSFYYENHVYHAALVLDCKIHDIFNTPESAIMVAETQLLMDSNDEVIKLLEPLDQEKLIPAGKVLLGIASARSGNQDKAKNLLQKLTPEIEKAEPIMLFYIACLSALTGNNNSAASILTHCFEITPPERLDVMRDRVSGTKDLAQLLGNPQYSKVLQTKSKIEEACSQGENCENCPSRGENCPKK